MIRDWIDRLLGLTTPGPLAHFWPTRKVGYGYLSHASLSYWLSRGERD